MIIVFFTFVAWSNVLLFLVCFLHRNVVLSRLLLPNQHECSGLNSAFHIYDLFLCINKMTLSDWSFCSLVIVPAFHF